MKPKIHPGKIHPGRVVSLLDVNSAESLLDLLTEYRKVVPLAFQDRFLIAAAKNLIKSFEANDRYLDYQKRYVEDIYEAIKTTLENHAPDFLHLGTIYENGHPGLGWYISTSDLEEAISDGEVIVEDPFTVDRRKITNNLILHVNDHGNQTLYSMDKKKRLIEIWAVV